MNTRPFILIPLVTALVACGGGNDSPSTASNEGTVSVLITDNLTLDYAEVWVNVQSISATDASGQSVTLYQDAVGQTHNLSQLVNIGALVDAQSVTPGTYTTFDIVLANDIKLVNLAGDVINANFDQSGSPSFAMTVPGSLVIDANQTSTLALDFDLAQFTYDATTKTVAPVVVQKDATALNQTVVTTQGQVQTVNSASQFVMTPATGGTDITVDLHTTATVTDAATGTVGTDTAGLAPGSSVSVSGVYDANTLTITASGVQVDSNVISIRHEIEGLVISFDGSTLVMDVKEASFAPSTNNVSVDISNAVFSKGSLAMVAAGQKVEVKGLWDGSSFSAAVVEIEGAQRNTTESRNYDDEYAEVKGTINSVVGDEINLTVTKYEHVSGISLGDVLTINSANSWFKQGDSRCLAANAQIEVKGAFTTTSTLDASVIEFESDCGGYHSDSDDDHDDDDDSENDHRDDDHGNDHEEDDD